MKNVLWAGALVAACLLLPARAGAGGLLPGCINAGFDFHFRVSPQGGPQLGPWYLYWPIDAQYQSLAPPSFPAWPTAPAALPSAVPTPPAPPPPGAGAA